MYGWQQKNYQALNGVQEIMSRVDSGLINMIDQIEKGLDELKSAQIFGSDSMNINSWTKEETSSGTYRVTLAPSQGSLGVLPMELSAQTDPSLAYGYPPTPVFRFDGTFQWKISLSDPVKIMLRWIGAGTVTWEKI